MYHSTQHTDTRFPMSPAAADVGLELRRIGGIDGAFNLLRRRAVRESDDVYAGRIELGVALLACKIGLGLCEAHTQRGAIKTPSSSQVDGQDCQQRQRQVDSSSVVEALLPTWGAKALVVVLETLLRGGRDDFGGRTALQCVLVFCTFTLSLQTSKHFIIISTRS